MPQTQLSDINSMPTVYNPRILITGITSIHGWSIYTAAKMLLPDGSLHGLRSPKSTTPADQQVTPACITDRKVLETIRDRFKPTHVIHAAGVCDLDVCEERPGWAHKLNVEGTHTMLQVFGGSTKFIHLSTDLVFSGNTPPAQGYTEEDDVDPVSVAGKTFAKAETLVQKYSHTCIVRLGLPIGKSMTGTKGAIDFIAGRLRRGLKITLFYDEIRSCVSCSVLGQLILNLVEQNLFGIYHLGGDQQVSLYKIGKYVVIAGKFDETLLRGISRLEEKNGPPRIGMVTLNSSKLKQTLGIELICNGLK